MRISKVSCHTTSDVKLSKYFLLVKVKQKRVLKGKDAMRDFSFRVLHEILISKCNLTLNSNQTVFLSFHERDF